MRIEREGSAHPRRRWWGGNTRAKSSFLGAEFPTKNHTIACAPIFWWGKQWIHIGDPVEIVGILAEREGGGLSWKRGRRYGMISVNCRRENDQETEVSWAGQCRDKP